MADYGKVKSTRLTASGTVKAIGGPAHIHQIILFNNGTTGVAGSVEVRDAIVGGGDTGTLRMDIRHGSVDEDNFATPKGVEFTVPLFMPDGIRVVFNTITNMVVWIVWEG